MDIGSAIRSIRKKRGITIAQLCEGTGLSKGFMSLIENNKTSPSIATLESIAEFLQVPLPYFLLKKDERMKIVKKDERKVSLYGKDNIRVETLGKEGGLQVLLIEIPPGYPKNEETNVHDGEEIHFVLKGKVLAQQGEDMAVLEEGDTFSWKACAPHIVKNVGDETAVLLIASYADSRKES